MVEIICTYVGNQSLATLFTVSGLTSVDMFVQLRTKYCCLCNGVPKSSQNCTISYIPYPIPNVSQYLNTLKTSFVSSFTSSLLYPIHFGGVGISNSYIKP
jgi:hypothetical protein